MATQLSAGTAINDITEGQELQSVEDEYFRYLIQHNYDLNTSNKYCRCLSENVPKFLRRHHLEPEFGSMFMTHDMTYVNSIIQIIGMNPLFKYEDAMGGHIMTHSLSIYVQFLTSDCDPRTAEYKKKNTEVEEFTEGKIIERHTNVFERKKCNRDACLKKHGYKCAICGFDFEKMYGALGKDYIEVHHIVPLSKIRREYIIDPEKDLIPLCSNCHSMIHRGKEPMDISELKKIVLEHKNG